MKTLVPIAVLSLVLAACHREAPAPEPVRPVISIVVAPGAGAARDVYSGELRARYETDLGFRIAGKMIARAVDAGAHVKKGQALARLDPEDGRLAVQAARAQVASADADLTLAHAELDRSRDLLAKKFISQSAFDAKQNIFDATKAKVDQARSQAAITSNQSSYTTLVSDADGVVVSVAAEPGQVVTAGQPVLRLAHDGEREVVVNAPESQLAQFHVGDPAQVSLWADATHPFGGRVREIAGGADPVTRTYTVRITAIDMPPSAQLGMTANVALLAHEDRDTVLLPLGALANSSTDPAVWVVDPKTSRVQLRKVTIGELREDGVTVKSGLQPGERVVTAGVQKLRPDQHVRVAASSTPTPVAGIASVGR